MQQQQCSFASRSSHAASLAEAAMRLSQQSSNAASLPKAAMQLREQKQH
jgi:hypothetical protein